MKERVDRVIRKNGALSAGEIASRIRASRRGTTLVEVERALSELIREGHVVKVQGGHPKYAAVGLIDHWLAKPLVA